ncbi:hypothetical protein IPG36_05300 [bacterium]|nr:MAG: hypothetical protein IPG36_05300 [bacterium]
MSVFQKSNSKQSSRRQINIKGVRDGVLLIPGDQYRIVLKASSINFELKSEDEQDALIETYQSFLNSLPCSVQIIARIREMDTQKYLDEFRASSADETDDIYRKQIENYTDFVQGLISNNKILSRQFYMVVPHQAASGDGFDAIKEQLLLNADIVGKGISRLGIQTRQLGSLELLDLFYGFYNPELAKRQPLHAQTMQLLKESYI